MNFSENIKFALEELDKSKAMLESASRMPSDDRFLIGALIGVQAVQNAAIEQIIQALDSMNSKSNR